MTNWSERQTKPLRTRQLKMATDQRNASTGPSQSRPECIFYGWLTAVHPENCNGYPSDDILDCFSSFE